MAAPRLRTLCSHNDIDVAVENMQEVQDLINRLSIIGLVEESVELGRRGAQPPNQFSLGQRARFDSFLRLHSQPVKQEVSKITRILVVLKDLFDMNRSLFAGLKDIDEAFTVDFLVH